MNVLDLIENIKWLPSFEVKFIDAMQILILALALYYLSKSLYKTRAWILAKGLAIIGAVYFVICLTEMTVLRILMEGLFSTLMIAIIIMLQPELQRIVELIGKRRFTDIKSLIVKKPEVATWYSEKTIYEIATACEAMGKVQTGALIVLERGIPLTEYVESGIEMDAIVSNQILINTFEKNTPLHDGAVIIGNNKITAATCYLPLSNNASIDKHLGTRHRAAIGVSENSDCVVIVVSEETGSMSFCSDGVIRHNVDRNELSQLLREKMKKSDERIFETRKTGPVWLKVLAPILSLVIWLSVLSNNDPIITQIISDIPVTAVNTDVLDDVSQAYTIKNGNTVSVKVQGKRSLIDNMTQADFIATADFTEMSIVYAVPINVRTTDKYADIEIIDAYNDVMKLEIEEIIHTEIPIEVKIVGDDNENYVVSLKDTEVNTIVVACPQSIARTLDKAVLTIDAYGKENAFMVNVQPVVYDRNGDKVPSNKISLSKESIRVTMDVHEVVEIPLVVTIKEQNVNADYYYVLNGYSAECESIRLAADAEMIDSLQSINVEIDPDANPEEVDTILINIKQYLPEGVQLAKDQMEQISVNISLTKYQKLTLNLIPANIRTTGINADSIDCTIIAVTSSIVLYYDTGLVDPSTITLDTLNPTLKITDTANGDYQGVVSLTDIEGVSITQEIVARYRLVEKRVD